MTTVATRCCMGLLVVLVASLLEIPRVAVAAQPALEDRSLVPLASGSDSDQGCHARHTSLLQTSMQQNASVELADSETIGDLRLTTRLGGDLNPYLQVQNFWRSLLGLNSSSQKRAFAAALEKPLLMVHIHKAGGTYMCQRAKVAGMLVPQPACNWEEADSYRMSCQGGPFPTCAERAAHYKHSGWTAGAIERELHDSDICPDDFRYSVLLRDPIHLIQSNLNFNYHFYFGPGADESMEILKAQLAGKRVAGEDALGECGHWKYMDNFQVRILAGATSVPAGKLTTAHLEKARARLSKFVAVEKLENLDDASRRSAFFSKLGWHILAHQDSQEKVQTSSKVMLFSAEQVSKLRELNALDYELYNSF